MIVWSLFDSGSSCYKQAIEKYFPSYDNYSIGIDKLNKNHNFINLDLADFKEIFGSTVMFDTLDKLPKPDIILASPPCESWSVASAMRGGNKFYVWEHGKFEPRNDMSIVSKNDGPFKSYPWKVLYTRVNGELSAYNTFRIIEKYKPKHWVIENPYSSHLWSYLEKQHGFSGILNKAHYSAYNDEFPKKATGFLCDKYLVLRTTNLKSKITIGVNKDGRKQVRDYNERSKIPLELIKDILEQLE